MHSLTAAAVLPPGVDAVSCPVFMDAAVLQSCSLVLLRWIPLGSQQMLQEQAWLVACNTLSCAKALLCFQGSRQCQGQACGNLRVSPECASLLRIHVFMVMLLTTDAALSMNRVQDTPEGSLTVIVPIPAVVTVKTSGTCFVVHH
jgi:hypothetical protein